MQRDPEVQGRIVYVGQLQEEGRFESEEGQFLWNGIFCRRNGKGRSQDRTVNELCLAIEGF